MMMAKKNKYYKQTYCNNQKAVSLYELDGIYYLGLVFLDLETGKYVVNINNDTYRIDINKIMPFDVAQAKTLKIAKDAGFNSYSEYQKFVEQQNISEREKKRQQEIEQRIKQAEENKRKEDERKSEIVRLRSEIDKKFGVIAIGSLLHVKNGEVKIGEIIRLGDTFSYYMDSWKRLKTGSYIFGDFDEFEIRGLDMRQVNVKVITPERSGFFAQGGLIDFGGRRGYIVKYLGTEDIITQGGIRRVIWVLECIGGNIYAE